MKSQRKNSGRQNHPRRKFNRFFFQIIFRLKFKKVVEPEESKDIEEFYFFLV